MVVVPWISLWLSRNTCCDCTVQSLRAGSAAVAASKHEDAEECQNKNAPLFDTAFNWEGVQA